MATDFYMPKLGLTMEAGTVISWLVGEGEEVEPGQPILEVETDKVVVEVEAPAGGIMGPLWVVQGQEVPIGTLLSVIHAQGESIVDAPPTAPGPSPISKPDLATVRHPIPAKPASKNATAVRKRERPRHRPSSAINSGNRMFSSPRARKRAREAGLEWRKISGTGPRGRVVERDVLRAVESGRFAAALPAIDSANKDLVKQDVSSAFSVSKANVDLTQLIGAHQLVAHRLDARAGETLALEDWLVKLTAVALTAQNLSFRIGLALPPAGDVVISLPIDTHRLSLSDLAKERQYALATLSEETMVDEGDDGAEVLIFRANETRFDSMSIPPSPPQIATLALGNIDGHRQATLTFTSDPSALPWPVATQLLNQIIFLIEEPLALLF
ncbi:MAG: hypothetical protein GY759_00060 [Chloroflexi bacterium]|nr:hypothetical protein [Chloroflexota bacterium]